MTGKAITRRALMLRMLIGTRRDVRSVKIQIALKVSSVQPRNFNAIHVISMDTSQTSVIRRNKLHSGQKPKVHMLQAGAMFPCNKSICSHSEDCSSSDESFHLQVKRQCTQAEGKKIPIPSHLITNLSYKLKSHQTRSQYLRARLDTCTDVNIMPASVYELVFNDPELKGHAPSNLEIGIYTTNAVKIVGSYLFYLVHPGTKKLQEVTFLCSKI